MAAEAAGAGTEEADAAVAGLVGRNKGPFCPQPASSPVPSNNSDAEITTRRRMQAIRWQACDEYKGAIRVRIHAGRPWPIVSGMSVVAFGVQPHAGEFTEKVGVPHVEALFMVTTFSNVRVGLGWRRNRVFHRMSRTSSVMTWRL